MKKVLLTLIMSFAFCGLILAQETHWPGFDYHDFPVNRQLIARVQIDGVLITGDDDFENIEICPFVNGQQRGYNGFMDFFPVEGDPYPIVDMGLFFTDSIFNNDSNLKTDALEALSFKMFNHAGNGVLYEFCETSVPMTEGEDYGYYSEPVVLNFRTTQTFEKVINGYGTATSGNYYLISSPVIGDVTPTADNGFLTNAYDLYRFNQAADLEWENWENAASPNNYHFNLVNGKGYLYANSGNVNNNPNTVTLTFEGVAYNGDGVVNLVYDNDHYFSGWNLIGNPFAIAATINKPYYKLNPEGTALTAKIEDLTNTIDAMEGVFVEATATGETAIFTVPTRNGEQRASAKTNIKVIGKEGKVLDNAIIRFDNGANLSKFQMHSNGAKVFFSQDGKDYAVINAGEMGEIPFSFKTETTCRYTLNFTSEEVSFTYLHLIDNMTGQDVDLLESPAYSFDAKTTDNANRFKLVFATGNSDEDSSAISNP